VSATGVLDTELSGKNDASLRGKNLHYDADGYFDQRLAAYMDANGPRRRARDSPTCAISRSRRNGQSRREPMAPI